MYEPYNYSRKIGGFDAFSGYPSIHPKDRYSKVMVPGAYSTTEDYEQYLREVLDYH